MCPNQMKIKRVLANNRKKVFVIELERKTLVFPYSELTIKPTKNDPLVHVYPDREIDGEGFTYSLSSKKEDTVLLDQVLSYSRDPDYVLEELLYNLTLKAQRALKHRGISKRELCRKLRTSPTQLYRLLDQRFYGKSLDQMVRLLSALGLTVDVSTKGAA